MPIGATSVAINVEVTSGSNGYRTNSHKDRPSCIGVP